jgi:membrane protein required for colicin V production
MTAIDWIALAILIGSLITGLIRGFVREAFSLVAWGIAFIAARTFWPAVAAFIPGVGQEGLRQAAAMVIIFVLVLILAQLLASVLARLMKAAGLGGFDHVLGLFFGVARAGAVLILLTLLVGLTALPRSRAWQESLVGGPITVAAQKVIPWLPHDLAVLIRFT